jgi:CRISPR-associated exonuclease Cas4
MPEPRDDFQPIRALNDLLFCERRCAMHRIEQVWVDNAYTLEGVQRHKRADRPVDEAPLGVRTVHAVLLKCERLRLTGKADVVEFHPLGGTDSVLQNNALHQGRTDCLSVLRGEVPYPVEYKRGRRRRWDNDDVQICAQAMCLEEMLGVPVPAGAIYHVKSKRRREIVFTPPLRARTEEAARRLHELFASAVTPPPVLKPRCRGCSLHDLCMPELISQRGRSRQYQRELFVAGIHE